MAFQTIEQATIYAYRVACAAGSVHHDAQDLAQDVAVQAVTAPPRSLSKSWIARAVHGKRVDAMRRFHARHVTAVGLPCDDETRESPDSSDLVRALTGLIDPSSLPWDEDPTEDRLARVLVALDAVTDQERAVVLAWATGHGRGSYNNRVKAVLRRVRSAVLYTETACGAVTTSPA